MHSGDSQRQNTTRETMRRITAGSYFFASLSPVALMTAVLIADFIYLAIRGPGYVANAVCTTGQAKCCVVCAVVGYPMLIAFVSLIITAAFFPGFWIAKNWSHKKQFHSKTYWLSAWTLAGVLAAIFIFGLLIIAEWKLIFAVWGKKTVVDILVRAAISLGVFTAYGAISGAVFLFLTRRRPIPATNGEGELG